MKGVLIAIISLFGLLQAQSWSIVLENEFAGAPFYPVLVERITDKTLVLHLEHAYGDEGQTQSYNYQYELVDDSGMVIHEGLGFSEDPIVVGPTHRLIDMSVRGDSSLYLLTSTVLYHAGIQTSNGTGDLAFQQIVSTWPPSSVSFQSMATSHGDNEVVILGGASPAASTDTTTCALWYDHELTRTRIRSYNFPVRDDSGNWIDQYARNLTIISDGYLISGQIMDESRPKPFIARINLSGELLWTRILDFAEEGYVRSVVEDDQGILYALGAIDSSGVFYWMLDADGQTLLHREIQDPDLKPLALFSTPVGIAGFEYLSTSESDTSNRIFRFFAGQLEEAYVSEIEINRDSGGGIVTGWPYYQEPLWAGDGFYFGGFQEDPTELYLMKTDSQGVPLNDRYSPKTPDISLTASPNPFNPETTISCEVAGECRLRVDIFNLRGQRIFTPLDETVAIGEHRIVWRGEDSQGNPVASGIYLCRVDAGGQTQSVRLLLLK
jgi:hypothetical protein